MLVRVVVHYLVVQVILILPQYRKYDRNCHPHAYDMPREHTMGTSSRWTRTRHGYEVNGFSFKLETDPIALVSIRTTKDLAGRMARWILGRHEYAFDGQDRKGRENANADALSRLPLSSGREESDVAVVRHVHVHVHVHVQQAPQCALRCKPRWTNRIKIPFAFGNTNQMSVFGIRYSVFGIRYLVLSISSS